MHACILISHPRFWFIVLDAQCVCTTTIYANSPYPAWNILIGRLCNFMFIKHSHRRYYSQDALLMICKSPTFETNPVWGLETATTEESERSLCIGMFVLRLLSEAKSGTINNGRSTEAFHEILSISVAACYSVSQWPAGRSPKCCSNM